MCVVTCTPQDYSAQVLYLFISILHSVVVTVIQPLPKQKPRSLKALVKYLTVMVKKMKTDYLQLWKKRRNTRETVIVHLWWLQ